MVAVAGAGRRRLYVSGYVDGPEDPGLLAYDVTADGSVVELVGTANGVASPSFCAFDGARVYAASETDGAGGLASFTLDARGVPHVDGHVSFSNASDTCFVLMHPSGRCLYGADYCVNAGGASPIPTEELTQDDRRAGACPRRNVPSPEGSLCVTAVNGDGAVSENVTLIQHEGHGAGRAPDDPNADRQRGAHVHTLSFVPGTRLLAAVDLGLDLIALYETDGEGRIQAAPGGPLHLERTPANGQAPAVANLALRPKAVVEAPLYSGPRIVAYHPTLPVAAVICELSCELLLYRISQGGLTWERFAQWDLLHGAPDVCNPQDFDKPPLAAHCAFSADGRFLYASTRGTNTMTVFALDAQCNQTSMSYGDCGGKTPRHFALSPDGALVAVANQTSDDVAIFARNASTGALTLAAQVQCSVHPSFVHWA